MAIYISDGSGSLTKYAGLPDTSKFEKVTTLWTGALQGDNANGLDLTMSSYKRLRVFVEFANTSMGIFEIDLTTLPANTSGNYLYNGGIYLPAYDDLKDSASYIGIYTCVAEVNSSKTNLKIKYIGYLNASNEFTSRSTDSGYFIYKIEGVSI